MATSVVSPVGEFNHEPPVPPGGGRVVHLRPPEMKGGSVGYGMVRLFDDQVVGGGVAGVGVRTGSAPAVPDEGVDRFRAREGPGIGDLQLLLGLRVRPPGSPVVSGVKIERPVSDLRSRRPRRGRSRSRCSRRRAPAPP